MKRLARNGVGLAFEDVGKGAPPLLLVHDLGCDHTSFAPQIEHFRHGHRVVAADLRGHGWSGGARSGQTIAEFVDDLAWLCYGLGVHMPVVIGRGIGGVIALTLAARYPDLPAAVVALGTPMGSLTGTEAAQGMAAAPSQIPVLYVDTGSEAADVRWLQEMCPRPKVISLDGGGHLLHLERPEQINALICSFLEQVGREEI